MSKKKRSEKLVKTCSLVHYVKVPDNYIVIDFDLKNGCDEINESFNIGRTVGLKEAWNIAAILIDWDGDSLERVFGTCNIYYIFKNYTPSQVIEKMLERMKTHEKN